MDSVLTKALCLWSSEASSSSKLQFTDRVLAVTGWLHLLGLLSPVLVFLFLEFLAHTHRGCPNKITMDELFQSGLHRNCCFRTSDSAAGWQECSPLHSTTPWALPTDVLTANHCFFGFISLKLLNPGPHGV